MGKTLAPIRCPNHLHRMITIMNTRHYCFLEAGSGLLDFQVYVGLFVASANARQAAAAAPADDRYGNKAFSCHMSHMLGWLGLVCLDGSAAQALTSAASCMCRFERAIFRGLCESVSSAPSTNIYGCIRVGAPHWNGWLWVGGMRKETTVFVGWW